MIEEDFVESAGGLNCLSKTVKWGVGLQMKAGSNDTKKTTPI